MNLQFMERRMIFGTNVKKSYVTHSIVKVGELETKKLTAKIINLKNEAKSALPNNKHTTSIPYINAPFDPTRGLIKCS